MMTLIGKITSAHGVKGDIILSHQLPLDFDTDLLDAIMIELNPKSYIPFFIKEKKETHDDEMILTLEEIDNREEAKKILNKNVFAPPTLKIEINNGNQWTDLIGFRLYDQNKLEIGKIEDVYINGQQILLVVQYKNDEILVPISDELILENDSKQKKITLEIADGLLEL
jgi:16S rRNA processing protein RimM